MSAAASLPDVVLELCGDCILNVPPEHRRLNVRELLEEAAAEAQKVPGAVPATIGRAQQADLHRRCIMKDVFQILAGYKFEISFDGQDFNVRSLTSRPLWIDQIAASKNDMVELAEDDMAKLPIGGHVVLSAGAGNVLRSETFARLRWQLRKADGVAAKEAAPSAPQASAKRYFDEQGQEVFPVGAEVGPERHCRYCHKELANHRYNVEGLNLNGYFFCGRQHYQLHEEHGPMKVKKPVGSGPLGSGGVGSGKHRGGSPVGSGSVSRGVPSPLGSRPHIPPNKIIDLKPLLKEADDRRAKVTAERLRAEQQWFGSGAVITANIFSQGTLRCSIGARRIFTVKLLKQEIATRLSIDWELITIKAPPGLWDDRVEAPVFDDDTFLGYMFPLEDFEVSLEATGLGSAKEAPRAKTEAKRSGPLTQKPMNSRELVPAIELRIFDDTGRCLVTVSAPRHWYIHEVKEEIAKRTKMHVWEQKLLVGEAQLDDGVEVGTVFKWTATPGSTPTADITLVQVVPSPDEEAKMYEVVAAHTPATTMELELRPGEHICVVEMDATGWWGGYRLQDGPNVLGWFPGNCVRQPAPGGPTAAN